MKPFLMIFGGLSALLLVSQLVMGLLILNGRAQLIKSHQHSGYLTVAVALTYILFSLVALASMPKREQR